MAIRSRAEFLLDLAALKAQYDAIYANNVTGDISPADQRLISDSQNSIFNDLVFSYLNTSSADVGSLAGSAGLSLVVNAAQDGFKIGKERAYVFENGNALETSISGTGTWDPLNVTLGGLQGDLFAIESGNGLKYLGTDTFNFKITAMLSGMKTSGAGGDNYNFTLSKDNATTVDGFQSKALDQSDHESCAVQVFMSLSTNDIVIPYAEVDSGSTNIVVENITMSIELF